MVSSLQKEMLINATLETLGRLAMVSFLLGCSVISSLVVSNMAVASERPKIIAVTSGTTPVYDEVLDHLNKKLLASCVESASLCLSVSQVVRVSDKSEDIAPLIVKAAPDLIITLGTRAAKSVADSVIKTPTLYALLPESAFNDLPKCCQVKIGALFLDQPLERQIRLIDSALPGHKRLGVLYGPSSKYEQNRVAQLAKQAGFQLESVVVENRAGVGVALKRLLQRIDVLLALPDPVVYSKQTVFNVLLSSYHNGVPVIGFSKGYVKAGALLALHSTPMQIGEQLADVLGEYFASEQRYLPSQQYPANFSVLMNGSVARSLKITLPDKEKLHKSVAGAQL
ncbi:MAG: hypothetical protein L3J28_07765 [Candidatus Polarisedimenticolaceae bacterium]|nr:hypothetical protein [Candidatus Polarisedimenticolaceae bacterium]